MASDEQARTPRKDVMRCGNDPNVELTAGDKAVVDWFADWLAWAWRRDNEGAVEPEPACPDGRAINVAARAQVTRCSERPAANEVDS
jgi:hypothetical protein